MNLRESPNISALYSVTLNLTRSNWGGNEEEEKEEAGAGGTEDTGGVGGREEEEEEARGKGERGSGADPEEPREKKS